MLSGNAADDAYVKCLAAMPLGMLFFRSHMLSGNAAPPRPLTIRKLLSLRADVGLKRKGRPRARQNGYTGRSALGDKTILHADGRNALDLDPFRAAPAALEMGVGANHWNAHRAQLPLLQDALGQRTDFLPCARWFCWLCRSRLCIHHVSRA